MTAFGTALLNVLTLQHNQQYGQALALLEDFASRHREHDIDHWLARSVLVTRARILADTGALEAARAAIREAQHLSPNASDFLVNQLALARLAEQPAQAIHELELGLQQAQGIAVPTAMGLLLFYAETARSAAATVPLAYEPLFHASCRALGLTPAPYEQGDPIAFTTALLNTNQSAPISSTQ
jgi:hypothetical protein